MLTSLVSFAFGLSFLSLVQAQDVSPFDDPNIWKYRSRPDLYPTRLFIDINEPGVTPGYTFMGIYQAYQSTATIYEINGEVVWHGFGSTGAGNAHDFQLCDYNGTTHLCFTEGTQYLGYSRGQSIIMDTNLQVVKTVQTLNGLSPVDQHEFNIVGDSAMVISYHPERYDLSGFGIMTGEGWVMSPTLQDINLTSGELIYEWSPIEHVGLNESYVLPNSTEVAGTGFSAISPWDYFHMNSIDKDSNGDYLISARHTSTLYRLNHTDGSIIWRCGGKMSDFTFLGGFNWSNQHDARVLESDENFEIISLFDNASNGFQTSANHSSGMIVKLNMSAMTVELLRSYDPPLNQSISSSQGNLQILNTDDYLNSNVFIGWGSQPSVQESLSNGSIIYHASAALSGPMSYRNFKFSNFTLNPQDAPALYTYAQSTTGNSTVFYFSWNGATKCQSWNIYGRSSCDGEWTLLGNTPKTGFETNYTASGYQEFGMVEAVDGSGTGLRNSTARGVKAFTPSPILSGSCSGDACQPAYYYAFDNVAQATVAESRSACGALPVETSVVSDASTSSGGSSGTGNSASIAGPALSVVMFMGVASTVLLMAVL